MTTPHQLLKGELNGFRNILAVVKTIKKLTLGKSQERAMEEVCD